MNMTLTVNGKDINIKFYGTTNIQKIKKDAEQYKFPWYRVSFEMLSDKPLNEYEKEKVLHAIDKLLREQNNG